MHFEILVEDESGKSALEILIPKIIGDNHTIKIISYKGLGRLPKNIDNVRALKGRPLLCNLPKILNGYGKTYKGNQNCIKIIIICDLDDKDFCSFHNDLHQVLNACRFKPDAYFCIAIEEGEAWLLGDWKAISEAYPKASRSEYSKYVQDSICGTWERLADVVYPKGAKALKKYDVGKEKNEWARRISAKMDVNNNRSSSFNYFKKTILGLI